MSDGPWTIERIRDALAAPALVHRFLSEINKAPAYELLNVFAKWERIAKDTQAALDRADEALEYDSHGEEPPGEWIDGTQRIEEAADRFRARGVA